MARYTGPKSKIARRFRDPIFGPDKALDRKSYGPGQHGPTKRRGSKQSEYAIQLGEKQKAKYTYGVLERQFRKTFEEASRIKGVTGENLIKLLESRLDNTIYRMGLTASRPEARQLVSHKHITVNGEVTNVPSYTCRPGDVIAYRPKSAHNTSIVSKQRGKNTKFSWVDWNENTNTGTFITMPEREAVPENIKEQLIVELYSK